MINEGPNYKQIFNDILEMKFPEKRKFCESILEKDSLNSLDIIALNKIIFNHSGLEENISNAKHKSYDKEAKMKILDYQQQFKLNNTQLSVQFELSRNTVAAWKKIKHL